LTIALDDIIVLYNIFVLGFCSFCSSIALHRLLLPLTQLVPTMERTAGAGFRFRARRLGFYGPREQEQHAMGHHDLRMRPNSIGLNVNSYGVGEPCLKKQAVVVLNLFGKGNIPLRPR